MKQILLILTLAFSFYIYGQSNYIDIPRTKLSYPILTGYKLDTLLGIVEKKDNPSIGIQFLDLDGGNFESNTRNFNSKKLEEQGLSVVNVKDTNINGFQAKIAVVQNEFQNLESIMLTFGSEEFSVLINAIYPMDLNQVEKDSLLYSVKNIKYNINKIVDPFEGCKFEPPNNLGFAYESFSTNMYAFSFEADTTEKILILQTAYVQGRKLLSVAAEAIHQAKSEGWQEYEIKKNGYCHPDKTSCFEVEGTCKINGRDKSFYYRFISDNKNVVVGIMCVISKEKKNIFNQSKEFAKKTILI